MNIWISAIIHLIYRSIRFVLHFFQAQIIWRITGVDGRLSKISCGYERENCQLLSIVYRRKLAPGDVSGATDFVWWHERFVSAKDVLYPDPHWTLYTLDKEFAYFLLMPEPWPYYHARNAPFAFVRQFDDGLKLARMPFKAFCRFAEECLPGPKGPVVYYSNAARCGTTLLTRVMQVSEERICCFGEPDAFTSLTMFMQRGFINENMALDLIKAIIKYYCKTQQPRQTYLFKVESNATYLAPLVKRAMPTVKHMFSYRRNTRRILSSVEKMFRGGAAGDLLVILWNICPWLACEFVNTAAYEYEMLQRFGAKDVLDLAIVTHLVPWYHYHKNRDIFDIPVVYYEDLIAEKERTLRRVFGVCELPFEDYAEEALREFEKDSQGGTHLNQGSMKTIKDTLIDDGRFAKIFDMCDKLNAPRIEDYQ